MPQSLHSQKINDEKDAFVCELFDTTNQKDDLISGKYSRQSARLHKLYMSFYVLNHFRRKELCSDYYDSILSCVIESESLFLVGLCNSPMMLLRSALEMSFKLLYFEYHPIELIRNSQQKFDLHGIEYREFLYAFPAFSAQNIIVKEDVEKTWSDLCLYTHFDYKAVETVSVISQITPIFDDEQKLAKYLDSIKKVFRIILCILFLVDPEWMKEVEKSYFDYPFEVLFNGEEKSKLILALKIV